MTIEIGLEETLQGETLPEETTITMGINLIPEITVHLILRNLKNEKTFQRRMVV